MSRRRWYFALIPLAAAAVGFSAWFATNSGAGVGPATPPEENNPASTNRLSKSNNPYLLLHADNPVDWYPWGSEAFEKARRESKPIFLSVGYSTCFWCHVAERTIYSDPEIAGLMNQWFVNVKVDREERPDVDQIYMLATRLMTGRGGWPNNVFLTPDLKPFFAGSYFPPADDPERGAGFPTILRELHAAWTSRRAEVLEAAENADGILRLVQARMRAATPAPVQPGAWLRTARESLLAQFDADHGGFGAGGEPKFPRSPELALLLTDIRQNGNKDARTAATKTLDAIALGGIHDHLAGGFHRYSIEPTWSVPHFEKMLYDNAQLLQLFAESHALTGSGLHRDMAVETARYLMREMTSPDAAGFFTAQDAQVEGLEGVSFVWTRGEIAAVLGETAAERFFRVYELAPMPEQTAPGVEELPLRDGVRPGVLRVRVPIETTIAAAGFEDASEMLAALAPERARLFAVRNGRPQPARDEKMLTGLNGLAVQAFARAGQWLSEPSFVAHAETVADRIWTVTYDSESRSLRHAVFQGRAYTEGFLQDYAQLGLAFTTLADVTGNTVWRDRAARLADDILHRFAREDGSFATTEKQENLLIAVADEGDGDAPSGTSAAVELLLRLGAAPNADPRFREAARRAIDHLSGALQLYPAVWSTTVAAVNAYPLPAQADAAAKAPPETRGAVPEQFRVPSTADHVRVSATAEIGSREDRVIVTVDVEPGYHINANPASFDYLIPTAVQFAGLRPSHVAYPQSARFKAAFAPEGLDVYEGSVKLVATFPRGTLPTDGAVRGKVTAQACDERVCLPPSELPFAAAAGNH